MQYPWRIFPAHLQGLLTGCANPRAPSSPWGMPSLGLGISEGLKKRATVNTCLCLKSPVVRLKFISENRDFLYLSLSWDRLLGNGDHSLSSLSHLSKTPTVCVHYSFSQCRCPEQTIIWPLVQKIALQQLWTTQLLAAFEGLLFCKSAGMCGTWGLGFVTDCRDGNRPLDDFFPTTTKRLPLGCWMLLRCP